MDDNSLDFEISEFEGSLDEFNSNMAEFFTSNERYRGYRQLVNIIDDLNLNDHNLYQAYHHGALAGLAAVELKDSILHFNIFVVNPDYREIGIGDELFDFIINQEKYSSAKFYESFALPGDRHTKNFFEQRKGKAQLLIVRGELKSN